ncbi:DUF3105 domain-containing protein [Paraconexibacter algicola]|uniref:DUF3105 domain-containing protein n=1 Tax=Paraconexibacter algicola TaxID=2133960 RepID=A0A2T4UIM9_9ACTN|nr:DUF3105 domain-containing protein [Paraconexibacter algicola]PTL59079.1 hypothetical protein C7Y72_05175 [Paraconexibacter algicola]
MSSRQEEKEARRRQREEEAAKAAKAEASKKRLQLVAGVAVAVLAVGGVTAAVLAGGGGGGGAGDPDASGSGPTVALAAPKITDLAQAAKAANCTLREQLPNEGNNHVQGEVTSYKTNPPTSGDHNIEPAAEGENRGAEYEAGTEPAKENWVHSLEHGRILFQYAPGTPTADVTKLRSLYLEDFQGGNGYHQMLFQNNTDMPFKYAAVAWTNYIGCQTLTDETIDAFRAFRAKYVDKGPELIP